MITIIVISLTSDAFSTAMMRMYMMVFYCTAPMMNGVLGYYFYDCSYYFVVFALMKLSCMFTYHGLITLHLYDFAFVT